jgi:hypothetical protein
VATVVDVDHYLGHGRELWFQEDLAADATGEVEARG